MFICSTERNIVIGSGNNLNILYVVNETAPILVATRSKTCICSRSLSGIAGLKPAICMDVCHLWLLYVVGKGQSLVECVLCLNKCDHEASIWGGPGPLWSVCTWKKIEMAIHNTTNSYHADSPSPLMYHANYFSFCTSAPLIIFLQTKFVFQLEVNLPSFYGMFITQSKSESHQQQLKLINITRQHPFLRWGNLSYQYEHNLTSTFTSALTFQNNTSIEPANMNYIKFDKPHLANLLFGSY
jgi:hypothetical protein